MIPGHNHVQDVEKRDDSLDMRDRYIPEQRLRMVYVSAWFATGSISHIESLRSSDCDQPTALEESSILSRIR